MHDGEEHDDVEVEKSNVLLIGPTGSGERGAGQGSPEGDDRGKGQEGDGRKREKQVQSG